MSKSQRVLVIGGTGFIGKHLIKKLLYDNYNITSLSINPLNEKEKNPKVNYIFCDLNNFDLLRKKTDFSFDYIFNLGGYINHSGFNTEEGENTFKTHFESIVRLVSSLDKKRLKHFIQIGSSDEYGEAPSPQNENIIGSVKTPYAKSKLLMTNYLIDKFQNKSFPTTIVRLFLVYGPGQDTNRLIPYVIEGCLRDQDLKLSSGEQLRDFTFIDDAVEGISLILKSDNLYGEIINLASGNPVKVKYVVKKICEIMGKGQPVFGSQLDKHDENRKLFADTNKVKNLLNWEAKIDLTEGLKKTIKFYETRKE